VLRKAGIEKLIAGGIVTNGGVSSAVRNAHARDIENAPPLAARRTKRPSRR
jgi:nicotinamidase-related amidase